MLLKLPELIAKARANVTCISAEQALSQTTTDAVFIDVREPTEFQEKSISCTQNIPRGLLEMQMLQKYPNSEQTIYLHCATGGRACLAAEQLMRIGYTNVHAITCKFDDICSTFAN